MQDCIAVLIKVWLPLLLLLEGWWYIRFGGGNLKTLCLIILHLSFLLGGIFEFIFGVFWIMGLRL